MVLENVAAMTEVLVATTEGLVAMTEALAVELDWPVEMVETGAGGHLVARIDLTRLDIMAHKEHCVAQELEGKELSRDAIARSAQ